MDIIGRAVIESEEKQAQVLHGSSKYVRIDPPLRHATPLAVVAAPGKKHVFLQSPAC